MLRKTQVKYFEQKKYNAISNKILQCNKRGQPVLVGTTSIEKSEKISKYLNEKKIRHNVLNAKHHEQRLRLLPRLEKLVL